MKKTVAFDPGIGDIAINFYNEVYIIENDLANMPQYPRKARYYMVAYKSILKAFLNNLAFYNACLFWAYYVIQKSPESDFTGNPFVSYTEEQKAQYAPTEMVDFVTEYLEHFKSDLKYYHIKGVEFPEKTDYILSKYREFIAINEGFINTHKVSDLKLPENFEVKTPLKDIKKMIDEAVEKQDLSKFLNAE